MASINTGVSKNYRFVKSAKLIAVLTLGSRLLGVFREYAFSHFFAATPLMSSFTIAFLVPNLARKLFGEGALTSSFIPIFSRIREQDGDEDAKKLAGSVFTLLTAVLTVLLILAELGLLITSRFTWGPTLSLTAILMPYMVMICVTAFFGGVLNSLNRFAAPAIAPMLLNVVLIASIWGSAAVMDVDMNTQLRLIAYSVLAAGLLQVGLQVWWLNSCGFRIKPNFNWSSTAVRQIMVMMGPMIVGLSGVQVNTFFDHIIAAKWVEDGQGPAILRYSQYISHLPLAVFGTALATAIFPLLSQRRAQKDHEGFAEVVEMGLRTAVFISVPAAVGLIMVANPVVRIICEHGLFTKADTVRVVTAIHWYCLPICAFAAMHIMVRAFYSLEDSKTPMRISLFNLVLNLALNVALVFRFKEAGVAMATAITGNLQAIMLAVCLRKRIPDIPWRPVASTAIRSLLAVAVMIGAILALRSVFSLGEWSDFILSTIAGALSFAVAAKLLKLEEMRILLRRN